MSLLVGKEVSLKNDTRSYLMAGGTAMFVDRLEETWDLPGAVALSMLATGGSMRGL